MSNTYTTNIKLASPAVGDAGWGVTLNGNRTLLDSLSPVGGLAVTTKEVPSASLNVSVAPGNFATSWGNVVSYAGTTSQAVAANATNYVYLDNTGALTVNTTGFPSGSFYVPLARVVAQSSAISTITDQRLVCAAVNAQAQPTGGAATAGATYTSAEQSMLNKCYSALRTLGLLS